MAGNSDREFEFWQSVVVRWLGIGLVGWLMILWFQGCLVPSAREDIRQQQEKILDSHDAK